MTPTIFYKITGQSSDTGYALQTYYVKVDGKDYFLFNQSFRRSNKEYFADGVTINELKQFSKIHSHSVRRILDKLPSYLRYIEKEYGVTIYDKSASSAKRKPYTRSKYTTPVAV